MSILYRIYAFLDRIFLKERFAKARKQIAISACRKSTLKEAEEKYRIFAVFYYVHKQHRHLLPKNYYVVEEVGNNYPYYVRFIGSDDSFTEEQLLAFLFDLDNGILDAAWALAKEYEDKRVNDKIHKANEEARIKSENEVTCRLKSSALLHSRVVRDKEKNQLLIPSQRGDLLIPATGANHDVLE